VAAGTYGIAGASDGAALLSLALAYYFVASVVAYVIGGVVARLLAGVARADAPGKLYLQGALLGAALPLVLAAPFTAVVPAGMFVELAGAAIALLALFSAISGFGAARALGRLARD
jgi:hypothetical protein